MELFPRKKLLNITSYLSIKIAGAGFLLFVMFTYLLVMLGMDLYKFVEGISNGYLWAAAFGYGIFCSLLIDLIVYKISATKLSVKVPLFMMKVLLYIIAGYVVFLIMGFNLFTLIAGTVGAICSLIFYFGTNVSSRSNMFRYGFGIVVPLLFIVLMSMDFTEKEQWVELKTDTSYTANFHHFNGKHEIPIVVKEGQTITISHGFMNTNGGGHGFHILNEKNSLVGYTEVSDELYELKVKDNDTYRVVVTGDDVRGGFKVNWTIDGG